MLQFPAFSVAIPTEGEQRWREIGIFEAREDAISFCRETFRADEDGRVSLITELQDEQDEGEYDPYAIEEIPEWGLVFELSVRSGTFTTIRQFQTVSKSRARDEGWSNAQEMNSDRCTVAFIRLQDSRGRVVWEKPIENEEANNDH